MKDACCWCLTIVEIPDNAPEDRRVYCCMACKQLDWMFRKWMNDKYLNLLIEESMNGPKDGHVPEV